eukprot:1027383-Rhodomonas_salina.1
MLFRVFNFGAGCTVLRATRRPISRQSWAGTPISHAGTQNNQPRICSHRTRQPSHRHHTAPFYPFDLRKVRDPQFDFSERVWVVCDGASLTVDIVISSCPTKPNHLCGRSNVSRGP